MKLLVKTILVIFFVSFSKILYSESTLKILSTTSTRDSGFYAYILPFFEEKFNIQTFTISTGTGQAIMNAKNCNGDILITHAENLENKFVEENYGISRNNLMYNNFIIIGPSKFKSLFLSITDVKDAFKLIYEKKLKFVSRGDKSGTHISEKKIWSRADIDVNKIGSWYLKVGQGMGSTLNIAIAMDALTYSDSATWLKFSNKQSHKILFNKDTMMMNQYGIVLINPKYCNNINHNSARLFHDWILSNEGQSLIRNYKYENMSLFIPNYKENN